VSAINGNRTDPVCVLGFGRSGTSLTMRLLNLLGVALGPEEDLLLPVEADNTRGYWEPQWMVELNDEILAELDTVWWRPLAAEPGWERREAFEPLRERAGALLQEKFGAAALWGWKDPRTTLTLPFWQELVPDAKYVICLRNPADAISSMQRRLEPTLPVAAWGDLWLEHIARALRDTDGRPRLLVFYEDFFREPHRQLERIASFLGVEPPDLDDPGSSPLGEIEAGLRHHSTSVLELAGVTGISPAARTVFFALRAAHDIRARECDEDGLSMQRAQALERVAPELWSERRLLNEARTAFAQERQITAALEQERRELTGEGTRLRDECAEVKTQLGLERDRFRDELESVQAELNQAREESRATEAARSDLEARLERHGAVLRATQSSVSWRVTAPLRAAKRLARRIVTRAA
jgi:hypothetical protein